MIPLSEKLRPKKLSEISGQQHLLGTIKQVIQNDRPLSILLFGPPGSGKTTIARLYAQSFQLPFERGFEREMKKRLEYFAKLRAHLRQSIR